MSSNQALGSCFKGIGGLKPAQGGSIYYIGAFKSQEILAFPQSRCVAVPVTCPLGGGGGGGTIKYSRGHSAKPTPREPVMVAICVEKKKTPVKSNDLVSHLLLETKNKLLRTKRTRVNR